MGLLYPYSVSATAGSTNGTDFLEFSAIALEFKERSGNDVLVAGHEASKEVGDNSHALAPKNSRCCASFVSIRCTNLARIFHTFKPSPTVHWHIPYESPNLPVISGMGLPRSLLIIFPTFSTFSSVRTMERLLLRCVIPVVC